MKRIILANFKGYTVPTSIDFSDITINVGMNSVGKSTAVQALLIVRQTFDELTKYVGTKKQDFRILLNGPYDLQLGDYTQITPIGADTVLIKINDRSFFYNPGIDKFSLSFVGNSEPIPSSECALFSPNFYYINAERLGPRNYQEIGNYQNMLCGYHGEYTFDVIEQFRDQVIPETRRYPDPTHTASILSKQTEYWMDYIVPGIEFNVAKDIETRTAKLKMRQTTLDTDFNSPHNFGFGISYLLPIVVTGLLAQTGSVFVVENPEAHLHPSGQSRIGQFLAHIAFSGVKIVLETHSEHVVNGIRLYALKHKVSPDRICINNFSIVNTNPCVEQIPLNANMDILKWPEGFFDQEEKDLTELRHLRRMQ